MITPSRFSSALEFRIPILRRPTCPVASSSSRPLRVVQGYSISRRVLQSSSYDYVGKGTRSPYLTTLPFSSSKPPAPSPLIYDPAVIPFVFARSSIILISISPALPPPRQPLFLSRRSFSLPELPPQVSFNLLPSTLAPSVSTSRSFPPTTNSRFTGNRGRTGLHLCIGLKYRGNNRPANETPEETYENMAAASQVSELHRRGESFPLDLGPLFPAFLAQDLPPGAGDYSDYAYCLGMGALGGPGSG